MVPRAGHALAGPWTWPKFPGPPSPVEYAAELASAPYFSTLTLTSFDDPGPCCWVRVRRRPESPPSSSPFGLSYQVGAVPGTVAARCRGGGRAVVSFSLQQVVQGRGRIERRTPKRRATGPALPGTTYSTSLRKYAVE